MADNPLMETEFDVNQQTYDWCVRAFDRVRKLLGVRIKMHHESGQIANGQIFLFNHFARFETFIPQYLIYKETGAFCRSIAAAEFFSGNDRFAAALRDLGVVPNDHPHLMETLAADILRGRKIVVFPEGGMVKDRQVVDEKGGYSVFSRHANERRKHHTGAARLAIGLHIFVLAVKHRARIGDHDTLDAWARHCGLGNAENLILATSRTLNLVPANITFYPLRISDNILRRGAELISGDLSKRAIDELTIEGNMLLKATDMDINLGPSLPVADMLGWIERQAAGLLARKLPDLGSIFDIDYVSAGLLRRTATRSTTHAISRTRDVYMQAIYQAATVNLSHLASSLILRLVEAGVTEIAKPDFRAMLYVAVKQVQQQQSIRLHRGLCDPGRYQPILDPEEDALSQLLDSASSAELLVHDAATIRFLPKLVSEHHFDVVRLENPIEVYANEIEPLAAVGRCVQHAIRTGEQLRGETLSRELFDDELRAHAWDELMYNKPRHQEINARETATADHQPFLIVAGERRRVGVVLVHGFLASPAEVREFGDKLGAAGYSVVGVRLKGHGTSPWDLRDRTWRDWLSSVAAGRRILAPFADVTVLVGFSTGGTLSFVSAAESPGGLGGVVAICPPIKFRNKNMRFVPLMHGANRIVRWLSSYEGVMPFRANDSEHPHINYRNMPLRGLYELTRLASHAKKIARDVRVPTCLIQATNDRVVDPDSATIAYDSIGAEVKALHWVESERHGILNEDIGATHQHVFDFLAALEHGPADDHEPATAAPADATAADDSDSRMG